MSRKKTECKNIYSLTRKQKKKKIFLKCFQKENNIKEETERKIILR